MSRPHVLIIDGDGETAVSLEEALEKAGVVASFANDAVSAIEKMREQRYCAVILDPMIRRGLNGYAVLDFFESEQPENLPRLFLLTGMSEQTIRRTAPVLLARLYRKPSGVAGLLAAVIASVHSETLTGEQKCVLLIEDDGPTAAATMALLHELSLAVEWVHDGRDAIDAVARRDFDIILLDLVLPGIDGFGVLDHLHAQHANLLGRVVITTGMPEKYLQLVPDHEVCGILRKPLDVSELQPTAAAGGVRASAAERRYLGSPRRQPWEASPPIHKPRSGDISSMDDNDVAAPRLTYGSTEVPRLTPWATEISPLRG